MNTKKFFYNLPENLIAQTPIESRDTSRMLVLNKENGKINNKHFYDILDYLTDKDCLILNDSRVLPARLIGSKKNTGGKMEFLLLKQVSSTSWETLVKPGRKAPVGSEFEFGNNVMTCKVKEVLDTGGRIVEFKFKGNFFENLDKLGQMPLPPYITEKLEDKERYQTVYSNELGSAAAPTAGLHFTKELLNKIKVKGVKIGYVTLHVGLGTFRPVKADNITDHKMHSEYYNISKETADIINKTKANGGKVFAVGTTTCRTLESAANYMLNKYNKADLKDENNELNNKYDKTHKNNPDKANILKTNNKKELLENIDEKVVEPCSGWTDIFIYPPYNFKVIDSLITNFHLPESTLIILVSAFAGFDNTINAYNKAVEEKYRFFSFGDSMLIV